MKEYFNFYINAERPQKGNQSNHVGIVVVKRLLTTEAGKFYYRFGIAVKHPRDRVPFSKKEARRIAIERVDLSTRPILTLTDLDRSIFGAVYSSIREDRISRLVNVNALCQRITIVLRKYTEARFSHEEHGG